jgi:phosphopantothenoylcysteine decarboxylase / phosphopantothenate---cysteine ligase
MRHTTVAGEADLVILAPATADLIAKVALGLAPDVLTAAVLATKSPVLVAPAMNVNMYESPITQRHLADLKKRGFFQLGPEKGFLACRYAGMGRMSDPSQILAKAYNILFGASAQGAPARKVNKRTAKKN